MAVLQTNPLPRQTYEVPPLLVAGVVRQQESPALAPQEAQTPLVHLVPEVVQ